jgi:hypothetical protein
MAVDLLLVFDVFFVALCRVVDVEQPGTWQNTHGTVTVGHRFDFCR